MKIKWEYQIQTYQFMEYVIVNNDSSFKREYTGMISWFSRSVYTFHIEIMHIPDRATGYVT